MHDQSSAIVWPCKYAARSVSMRTTGQIEFVHVLAWNLSSKAGQTNVMSRATKRKHVTREVVEDEVELKPDQKIVKVSAANDPFHI